LYILACQIFLIAETQNLVIIDLICPNRDPEEYFERKIIGLKETNIPFSKKNWTEFTEELNNCPHALAGKKLKAGKNYDKMLELQSSSVITITVI
jgi:hypothetical protein